MRKQIKKSVTSLASAKVKAQTVNADASVPAEGTNAISRTDLKPDPAWLLLDNQLCFSAYALSREIISLYRPFLEPLGITYTQYITLMVLWEERKTSMKHLGERLFLDSGTLTPLLKKLTQMGLVEKERDPEDERSVLVNLTDKGLALREQALGIPVEILCGTGLDVETAVQLREVMKKMAVDIRQRA